ncbi:MAG TPA: hypothetical protein VK886_15945 [Vicinamibacterales bacterium]|nr:hypothetical protein [Vicinamibacterales bacterium]
MRKAVLLCSLALALMTPASVYGGELKLTMTDGRVTLIADAVPVRTILQEWARIGQSRIVNGEKVMGAPLTLRLINVPEAEALDVVLRSASGYLAAPRPVPVANASLFDRIVILPTSRPTTTTAAAPPPQQPQRQPFPGNQPVVQAPIIEDDEEPEQQVEPDENPPQQPPVTSDRPGPIQVTPASPGQRPPGQPQQPGQPGMPQQPITSPRPGVITPPPAQQQPPPPPRPIP